MLLPVCMIPFDNTPLINNQILSFAGENFMLIKYHTNYLISTDDINTHN